MDSFTKVPEDDASCRDSEAPYSVGYAASNPEITTGEENKHNTTKTKTGILSRLQTGIVNFWKTLTGILSRLQTGVVNICKTHVLKERSEARSVEGFTGAGPDGEQLHPYNELLAVDSELKWSNPNIEERLRENEDLAEPRRHPNHVTLAKIASAAYKAYNTDVEEDVSNELPEGWVLLTMAWNREWGNGYHGIAVWQPQHRCLVIAHKGTSPKSLNDYYSDLIGVALNKLSWVKSISSAVTFAHEVVTKVRTEVGGDFEIYVTGHSLGGWIAPITTYTLQFTSPKNNYFLRSYTPTVNKPHCVAFDPPGCKEMLDDLVKNMEVSTERDAALRQLHLVSYLSAPNIVSVIGTQRGVFYEIFSKFHGVARRNLLDLHSIDNFTKEENFELMKVGKQWPSFFSLLKGKTTQVLTKIRDGKLEEANNEFWENCQKLEGYSNLPYQLAAVKNNTAPENAFTESEWKFLQNYKILFPTSDLETMDTEDRAPKKMSFHFDITDGVLTCTDPGDILKFVPYVRKLLRDHPFFILDKISYCNKKNIGHEGLKFGKNIVDHHVGQMVTLHTDIADTELTAVRVLTELERDKHNVKLLLQSDLRSGLLFNIPQSCCFVIVVLNNDTLELISQLASETNIVFLISSLQSQLDGPSITCEAVTLEDFHQDTQKAFLEEEIVKFAGREEILSVKDITKCRHPLSVSNILNTTCIRRIIKQINKPTEPQTWEIGNTVRELRKLEERHYVERTFLVQLYKIEDISSFMEKNKDSRNLFFVTGMGKTQFQNLVSDIANVKFGEEKFLKYTEDHIGRNVVVIHCIDNNFYMSWSLGNNSAIVTKDQLSPTTTTELLMVITENELLELPKEKISVISGSPGLGKSEVLRDLCRKLRESKPKSWVIPIELSAQNFTEVFRKHKQDKNFFINKKNDVVEFLAERIQLKGDERAMFGHCMRHESETYLLLDGFDEISPDYEDFVMQMLLALKETEVKRVFVTSRNHLVPTLEKQLHLHSFILRSFSEDDIETYIEQNCNKKEKIRAFLSMLRTGETARGFQDAFINPLTLRMLREVSDDETDSEDLAELANLSQLYTRFVGKKIDKYLQRIFSVAVGCSESLERKKTEEVVKNLKEAALRLLLPSSVLLKLRISEEVEVEMFGVLYGTGLLEPRSDGVYKFFHQTFAEFFIAKYFVDRLQEEETMPDELREVMRTDILVEDKHAVVRRFMDDFLDGVTPKPNAKLILKSENEKGHFYRVVAIEDLGNIPVFFSYGLDNEILVVETKVAHVACELESYKFLSKFMKQLSKENQRSILEDKNRLGDTPLEVYLKFVVKYDKSKVTERKAWLEYVAKLVDWSLPEVLVILVHGAVTHGFYFVVDIISANSPNKSVLDLVDEKGLTTVHHIMKRRVDDCCDLLKWMEMKLNSENLELNCLTDKRDKQGASPLHHAMENCHFEVAEFVIKRQGGSKDCLLTTDKEQRNAIHWLFEGLFWLETGERRDKVLNWFKTLLDEDFFQFTDVNGGTYLHDAFGKSVIDFGVVILMKDSRSLWHRDKDGLTPIHRLMNSNNWNYKWGHHDIRHLKRWLEQIFSQNVIPIDCFSCVDNKGATPVHYAMGKGLLDVVDVIIEKFPKCLSEKDNTGQTPVHWLLANESGEQWEGWEEFRTIDNNEVNGGQCQIIEDWFKMGKLTAIDFSIKDNNNGKTPEDLLADSNVLKSNPTNSFKDRIRDMILERIANSPENLNSLNQEVHKTCLTTENTVWTPMIENSPPDV